MRVVFYISRFSFRGTEQAVYDYADELEKQGWGQSYILYWNRPDESAQGSDSEAMQVWEQRAACEARAKFERRFGDRMMSYDTFADLDRMLPGFDLLYLLTHGDAPAGSQASNDFDLDSALARKGHPGEFGPMRIAYHFVYRPTSTSVRSASISGAVARRLPAELKRDASFEAAVVPHIVREWNDLVSHEVSRRRMREYLGIPASATVFGRLGGIDTFNIEPVVPVILDVLSKRNDVYFVFATAPFVVLKETRLAAHPCVIFIEPTFEDATRAALIDACDYMLHASALGETFGLAVLEFLSRAKPVLAFEPRGEEAEKPDNDWSAYHRVNGATWAEQHLIHLWNCPKGYYLPYWSSESLSELLMTLRQPGTELASVTFSDYTPAQVMDKFARTFLLLERKDTEADAETAGSAAATASPSG